MKLDEIFEKRRSWRNFTDRGVSENLVRELISAASKSPVSCNLQLTQYVVINDPILLQNLTDKVSYKFKYSKCNIIVLHDSRFSIERSSGIMTAGMAVENLLLKATELGLGTCAMAGFKKDNEIKAILNIPYYMDILLVIAVGYPDYTFNMQVLPRIDLDQRYKFNNYKNLSTINTSLDLSKQSILDIKNYRSRISPVYLDRLRLNTYNGFYYEDVLVHIINFLKGRRINSIFDLISYDGIFLNMLSKVPDFNDVKIVTSDYLENNLAFFKKKFNYNGVIIDNNNNINLEEKFDMVTFVFQTNFTPELPSLLRNVKNLLNNKGCLVVSVVHESWYRVLARFVKKLILIINGKKINIYENNPFYKIGPYKNYSRSSMVNIFESNGFVKIQSSFVKKGKGVSIGVYFFHKR